MENNKKSRYQVPNLERALKIMEYLATLSSSDNCVFQGDFNFYSSNESGFQGL